MDAATKSCYRSIMMRCDKSVCRIRSTLICVIIAMAVSVCFALLFGVFMKEERSAVGKPDGMLNSPVEVGATLYDDFEQAWNNATDGSTIKLTGDTDVNTNLTMSTAKTVTLDLNGHVLNFNADGIDVAAGTFIIDDSDPTAKNTVTSPNFDKGAGGTKTFDGGVILINKVPDDTDPDLYKKAAFARAYGSAKIVLNNGTVTGATDTYVRLFVTENNASFTMNGGAISHNGAMAIVSFDSSVVTMNGGEMSYNQTDINRWGVIATINTVTVNLFGGTISNNSASVDVQGNSTLNLGGDIAIICNHTNATDRVGGGVHADNDVNITVKGHPVIKGNTCLVNHSGTYLREVANIKCSKPIQVVGALELGAYIGIKWPAATVATGYTQSYDPRRFFVADDEAEDGIVLNGTSIVNSTSAAHTIVNAVRVDASDALMCTDMDTAWQWALNNSPASIVLVRDTVTTKGLTVPAGKDIRIELCGRSLKFANSGNYINVLGSLTLNDDTPTNIHYYSVDSNGLYSIADDSVINSDNTTVNTDLKQIAGGVITGGFAPSVRVNVGATFTMSGGNIIGSSDSGSGSCGGGVAVYGKADLTGGKIIGNRTTYGGGIYVEGSSASFTMGKVTVSDNVSTNMGGGMYIGTQAKVGIDGATIRNNTSGASSGGIIIVDNVTATLKDTEITENKGQTGGGLGVFGVCDITLSGCKITNNNAAASSVTDDNIGSGGGIAMRNSRLTLNAGTVIADNHAVNNGGGVYCDNSSSMTGNSAVTVNDAEIRNNDAAAGGGGIYISNVFKDTTRMELTVAGGNINNNSASVGGGVFLNNYIDFVFNDGYISDNKAEVVSGFTKVIKNCGGGIFAMCSPIEVSGTAVVDNNTAEWGGGIYWGNTTTTADRFEIVIKGGTISDNHALIYPDDVGKDGYGQGGGIYAENPTQSLNLVALKITGGIISGNDAANYGGGVHVYNFVDVTVGGSAVVTKNSAVNYGGGISVQKNSAFTMSGGKVTANSSNIGGGIEIYNSGATISGGEISGNTAATGGGISFGASQSQGTRTLSLDGGKIINNTASSECGGVHFDKETYMTTYAVIVNIKGKLAIDGNQIVKGSDADNAMASNVTLPGGVKLAVKGDLSGSKIGVAHADGGDGVFTSGYSTDNLSLKPHTVFSSDSDKYIVLPVLSGNEATLGVGLKSLTVTDNKMGGYTAFDTVNLTVKVEYTDGQIIPLGASDFTVVYPNGGSCLWASDTKVTVTYKKTGMYTKDGDSELSKDVAVTVAKKAVNVSDTDTYKYAWKVKDYGVPYSGSVYEYEVDGIREYYYAEQSDRGEANIIGSDAIVRYRNKYLTLELDCNTALSDIAEATYSGEYMAIAHGKYSAKATLTLKDVVNYVFKTDDADTAVVLGTDGKTAEINKVWYIVHIDNGILSQTTGDGYGKAYSLPNWTFGDSSVALQAPRLEHGDGDDVTAVFGQADDRVRLGVQPSYVQAVFGGQKDRYDFGRYINYTMPAGSYLLEIAVDAVTISGAPHTHWYDGAVHDMALSFTVNKANFSGVSGAPSGMYPYVYEKDTVRLDSGTLTATLMLADAADRVGFWANTVNTIYYATAPTVKYNLAVWDNNEFYTSAEISELPDNIVKPIGFGQYVVYYKLCALNYNDYGTANSRFTVNIAKATYVMNGITFIPQKFQYDGMPVSAQLGGSGKLPEGVSVKFEYYNSEGKKIDEAINVGIYKVIAVFAGDYDNYIKIENMETTLEITKGTQNMFGFSMTNNTVTYTGGTFGVNISGEDGLAEKNISVKYYYKVDGVEKEFVKQSEVGEYIVTAKFTCSDENYGDIQNMTAKLTITQAKYDMTAVKSHFTDAEYTYTGDERSLTVDGAYLPSGVSVTYEGNCVKTAGTHYVTAKFTGDAHNYEAIDDITVKLVILPAEYNMGSVSFIDSTVQFDGEEHSIFIKGALPDGVSVSYSGNAMRDVGDHTVTAMFIGDTQNYKAIKNMTAQIHITPRATCDMNGIEFNGQTVTYSGSPKNLFIQGSLPYSVSVTYEGNGKTTVGTYIVTAKFTSPNYSNIPDKKATLTIKKATYDMSQIRFDDGAFKHDGNEKSIFVSGELPDGITVTYVGNGMSAAGEYTVTAKFTGDAENYEIVPDMTAKLFINKSGIIPNKPGTSDTSGTGSGSLDNDPDDVSWMLFTVMTVLFVSFVAISVLIARVVTVKKRNDYRDWKE